MSSEQQLNGGGLKTHTPAEYAVCAVKNSERFTAEYSLMFQCKFLDPL